MSAMDEFEAKVQKVKQYAKEIGLDVGKIPMTCGYDDKEYFYLHTDLKLILKIRLIP